MRARERERVRARACVREQCAVAECWNVQVCCSQLASHAMEDDCSYDGGVNSHGNDRGEGEGERYTRFKVI